MNSPLALARRHFGVHAGELTIDDLPVTALAEQYGTPLFAYSSRVLDRKLSTVRETFGPDFAISYSVKANPNRRLLEYFVGHGCGLEVASGGELLRALKAGCPAERILFAGPGKTEAELELALEHAVGEIHIESLVEGRRLATLGQRRGERARIAVRVNPTGEAQGGAMRMGGKPTPFGIDEEGLDEALAALGDEATLDVRGLHLFTGTQILDHTVLAGQYAKALALAGRAASRLGHPLHTLDLGGGLGIPYFPGERELDMGALHEEIVRLLQAAKRDAQLQGTRLVLEPGRYLVGEAGIYIARVNDVKVSRGKTFLVLDGGMNHHLAASGNLGQVIKRNFPLGLINKLDAEATHTVDVVGPLCTPLDTLAREAALPAAQIGDLVGIFQAGAYTLTASPMNFLSHPTPAEILIDGGAVRVIRRRGSFADVADGAD